MPVLTELSVCKFVLVKEGPNAAAGCTTAFNLSIKVIVTVLITCMHYYLKY